MQPRHRLAISTWGEEEVEAGSAVLRSGLTTMGQQVAEFERQFAELHGCRHSVMVNSGSSANLLMVAALVYTGRLWRGARVAVPAVSWSTTYSPLAQFGMRMVLCDIDDSLNIDPHKIPSDVDAIFAVNLLGNPCHFDQIRKKPILIEDNCESLGAQYYGGQWTGTFGCMGSHSLFFSHHISTMEGGVITTDDEELWRALLMLRAHGWTRDLPEHQPGFHSSFEFHLPGYSMRPTEVAAAIGIEQLKKLPAFLEQRRANAKVYGQLFGDQREIGRSSWFGFAILHPKRAELLPEISKEFDVRPIVAGNIERQRMLVHCDYEAQPLVYADYVDRCGFFIGNHHVPCEDALHRLHRMVQREAA